MINKVTLLGNLGRDPELKDAGSTTVCTLAVATTSNYKKDGEWKKKTTWHQVKVWGKTGESCKQYLAKGSKVYIEGSINNDSYEDKDGNKKYYSEVVASTVKFLNSKKDSVKKETTTKHHEEKAPVDDNEPPF